MLNISNPEGGKFPIITKELNPLQGLQQSKIDFYNLGEKVKKLREARVGVIKIAKELNEKYLIPEGLPTVSHGSVTRWCNDNIPNIDCRNKEDFNVNIYNEHCSMLATVETQIGMLTAYMEHLDNQIDEVENIASIAKDIKDLMFAMDKLLARKQSLLSQISEMQQKVYSFAAANDIVRETLEIVKESDLTIYAEVIDKIKSNEMLRECMKRIQPNKA